MKISDSEGCEKSRVKDLVNLLAAEGTLSDVELADLITDETIDTELAAKADEVRRLVYGEAVYIRGLIEFTNYCANDCYYCGIRRSIRDTKRYRLSQSEIMECCGEGYSLGFRTFVLQGGEDPYYNDQRICSIVSSVKERFPDCAVTLSIGEKSRKSYRAYYEAGADRYLLRHETADGSHYMKLHPEGMSLSNRKRCLFDLKEIGYQVGSGFMVGSPYQTADHLTADLRFLQELQPDMIGIGPYIEHLGTPVGRQYARELSRRRGMPYDGEGCEFSCEMDRELFALSEGKRLSLTLRLISILRLMFPYALIPSTTALGTIHPQGRELGLKAGANVVMPNLSPVRVRSLYDLYENKLCTGEDAVQCRGCLENRVFGAGYHVVTDIGNVKKKPPQADSVWRGMDRCGSGGNKNPLGFSYGKCQ